MKNDSEMALRFCLMVTLLGVAQVGVVTGCGSNSNSEIKSNGTTSSTSTSASVGGSSSGSAQSTGGVIASQGGASNSSGGGTPNGSSGGNRGTETNTTEVGTSGGTASGTKGSGGSPTGGNTSTGGSSNSSAGGGGTSQGGSGGPLGGGSSVGGTTNPIGGTGGSAGGTQAVGGGAAVPATAAKDSEGEIALSGLTDVSYGGYLNGESFQQEGILTYNGYQYTAFWNDKRNVVMARRKLPSGAWVKFDFTDYANTEKDAHNTISLGVTPGDGTLHLSFDHHSTDLHYRKSVEGLITSPDTSTWAASSFPGGVKNALVGSTIIAQVTYPRFVTEPGGQKMLFSARIGTSGSGDEYLWEYSAATHGWASLGKYIDGISDNINAYLHSLTYTRGGSRLHASWCWRETPDAWTNHDLLYVYSDDHGRTWKNNGGTQVGTSGSSAITATSSGINVWPINQRRGLINQEHMAVDSAGRVHVLLSHMPDNLADDQNFDSSRTKSQYFHYWRDASGKWTRTNIAAQPVVKNFRGKLAIASSNNVYAILPGMRIAGASAGSNYSTWTLLTTDSSRSYFSDPLIDSARLEVEDKLTVYYPQASSKNIWGLEYSIK